MPEEGIPLADAFIKVSPDFSGFEQKVKAESDEATRGGAKVKVTADTSQLKTAVMRDSSTAGSDGGRSFGRMFQGEIGKLKPSVKVKAEVDKDSLKSSLTGALASVAGIGGASKIGEMSLLQKAILAVNLATGIAEPALAALTATTASLSAGLIAAGPALLGFGLVAESQISGVTQAIKDQAAAMDGTAAAKKKYQNDLAALSPVQKELLSSLTDVKQEYKAWGDDLAKPVLTPLISGLKDVNPLLKDLAPFVREGADAIDVLESKLNTAITGTGFQAFLKDELPLVKPVIMDLGESLGNIVVGIGGMLHAFNPFVDDVFGGLDKITEKFKDWGTTLGDHSGFQSLISEWKQNWPLVEQGLGSVATILKNVLSDVAGISTGGNSKALWDVANPILALLASLSSHPDVVRSLLYVMTAIDLAKKAGGVISVGVKLVGAGEKLVSMISGGTLSIGNTGALGLNTTALQENTAAILKSGIGGGVPAGVTGDVEAAEGAGTAAGIGDLSLGSGITGLATGTGVAAGAAGAAALVGAVIGFQYLQNKLDPTRPVTPQQENDFSPSKQAAQRNGGLYTAPGGVKTGVTVPGLQGSAAGGALTGNEYGAVFSSATAKADLQWLMKTYGVDLPQAINIAEKAQLDLGKNIAVTGTEQKNALAYVSQWFKQINDGSPAFDKAIKSQALYTAAMTQFNSLMKAGHPIAEAFSGDLITQGTSAQQAGKMVDAYAADVLGYGKNADQTQAARAALVADFKSQGLSASAANKLVNLYTGQIGANAKTTSSYKAIRQQLVTDFKAQGQSAASAEKNATAYTVAIVKNNLSTSQGHASREQIIKDLEQAGANAKTATTYADNYTTSLGKIPKDERTTLTLKGDGTWSVTEAQSDLNSGKSIKGVTQGAPAGVAKARGGMFMPAAMALGGVLPGYEPGHDRYDVKLGGGEGILVPEAVRGIGGEHAVNELNYRYAGYRGAGKTNRYGRYASGGLLQVSGVPGIANTAAGNVQATNNAMIATMKSQMLSYIKAQESAAQKLISGGGGTAGPVTSGVAQWAPTILKALALLGLPASLLPLIEHQMETESGGNQAAINLWDSNAAAGHPSKGLMQVIQGTFDEYHVPGTSTNIYDPLANIAAALNYANHGAGFGTGPGQVGSGHGYAAGGVVKKPASNGPFSGSVSQSISGTPAGGWVKDVSKLTSGVKNLGIDMQIKGLTNADVKKLKAEQNSEENELLVAKAVVSQLKAAASTLSKTTIPKVKQQISALSKLKPLSASEKKALATLKAALKKDQSRYTAVENALNGKPVAKSKSPGAAGDTSSDAGTSDDSGGDSSSSDSASAPQQDPGAWVGALPGAPGSLDIPVAGSFAQAGTAGSWLSPPVGSAGVGGAAGGFGGLTGDAALLAAAWGGGGDAGGHPGGAAGFLNTHAGGGPAPDIGRLLARIAAATERGPAKTAVGLDRAFGNAGRGATISALYGTGTGY